MLHSWKDVFIDYLDFREVTISNLKNTSLKKKLKILYEQESIFQFSAEAKIYEKEWRVSP